MTPDTRAKIKVIVQQWKCPSCNGTGRKYFLTEFGGEFSRCPICFGSKCDPRATDALALLDQEEAAPPTPDVETGRAIISPGLIDRLKRQPLSGELTQVGDDIWISLGPIAVHTDNTKDGCVTYGVVLINDGNYSLIHGSEVLSMPVGSVYRIDGRVPHGVVETGGQKQLSRFAFLAWDMPQKYSVDEFRAEVSARLAEENVDPVRILRASAPPEQGQPEGMETTAAQRLARLEDAVAKAVVDRHSCICTCHHLVVAPWEVEDPQCPVHGDSAGKPARLVNEVRRLAAERDLALASSGADRAKLTRCLETQRKIEAENARLRKAHEEIARQHTQAEREAHDEDDGDIDGAYDFAIGISRAALAAEEGET